jgi:hypothetical protein
MCLEMEKYCIILNAEAQALYSETFIDRVSIRKSDYK